MENKNNSKYNSRPDLEEDVSQVVPLEESYKTKSGLERFKERYPEYEQMFVGSKKMPLKAFDKFLERLV